MFIFREACESLPGAAPGRSRGARVVGFTREASGTFPGAAAGRSRGACVVGLAREAGERLPGAAAGKPVELRVVVVSGKWPLKSLALPPFWKLDRPVGPARRSCPARLCPGEHLDSLMVGFLCTRRTLEVDLKNYVRRRASSGCSAV